MFVETRYFDDGKVLAKMYETNVAIADTDKYDSYLEDYKDVEEFAQELTIDTVDIVPLTLNLNAGGWVDITDYVW